MTGGAAISRDVQKRLRRASKLLRRIGDDLLAVAERNPESWDNEGVEICVRGQIETGMLTAGACTRELEELVRIMGWRE